MMVMRKAIYFFQFLVQKMQENHQSKMCTLYNALTLSKPATWHRSVDESNVDDSRVYDTVMRL